MKVMLQMEFQSLAELKAYIEETTTHKCTCAPVTPSVPFVTGTSTEQVANVPVEQVTVFPPQEEAILATVNAASTNESVVSAPVTTEPATPVTATPTAEANAAGSTAEHSYSLDDLARAGAELVDLGKQPELPKLMQDFQITSLPELPKERYGEFATRLREMGASI